MKSIAQKNNVEQLTLKNNLLDCFDKNTPAEFIEEVKSIYVLVDILIQHQGNHTANIQLCRKIVKRLGFHEGIFDIIYNERFKEASNSIN
ncbi:MAG: hypothetical protein MI866_12315 [Bacteroidales bacterium]|nr:hypothetical protein [Bacteroidales bacterium]